ncbi:MAG TPA: hypothetical protein VIG64_09435 [Actinomycetota bacterium]|jgi:uncharacterized membrane protein YidH (DUF202 family)
MGRRAAGSEETSGRPLRDVYSVSLGVALVIAVEQLIDLERPGIPMRGDSILPFLAFVMTAFSLYHWAIRFIDLPAELDERRPRKGTVATLLVGATELLLVIGLSTLVSKPATFLGWLATLLGFELVAGVVLRAARAYGGAESFARRYLVINGAAFACALAGALVVSSGSGSPVGAGVVVAGVATARATAFYSAAFDLLFGDAA